MLTDDQRDVYVALVSGSTQCEIASMLGISQPAVSQIKRRADRSLLAAGLRPPVNCRRGRPSRAIRIDMSEIPDRN